MEDNLDGVRVGGDNDQVGDASVEGLGHLVGPLFDLLQGCAVLDEGVDLLGEVFVGERLGTF